MACEKWYFEPIFDDLQAPCNSAMRQHISTNPYTAQAQGVTAADNAIKALANLGLQGSIAYFGH